MIQMWNDYIVSMMFYGKELIVRHGSMDGCFSTTKLLERIKVALKCSCLEEEEEEDTYDSLMDWAFFCKVFMNSDKVYQLFKRIVILVFFSF